MAQAGYYPDPFEDDDGGRLRWWGGGTWAVRTIPEGGPVPPVSADDHPPERDPVSQDVIDAAKARAPRTPADPLPTVSPASSSMEMSAGKVGGQLVGWIGVLLLAAAGIQMLGLESVAGNTVAEEFYNLVGLAILGGAASLASTLLRSY